MAAAVDHGPIEANADIALILVLELKIGELI
jgi:hypothetical protein